MTIQSLSKRAASKYKPERPTLLISIQDGDKQELPFKQRTNHITRKRYVDCLFLYFDDVEPDVIPGQPTMPFAFSDEDAKAIIVHCQAGVSRSHAVALFIAKYFAKDEAEYSRLLGQENKVYGGNHYVYNKLVENLERNEDDSTITQLRHQAKGHG